MRLKIKNASVRGNGCQFCDDRQPLGGVGRRSAWGQCRIPLDGPESIADLNFVGERWANGIEPRQSVPQPAASRHTNTCAAHCTPKQANSRPT